MINRQYPEEFARKKPCIQSNQRGMGRGDIGLMSRRVEKMHAAQMSDEIPDHYRVRGG